MQDEQAGIDFLRELEPKRFASLREAKRAFDRWFYAELLVNPTLIPDQVERLKKISQLKIGVPWWLSEVEYQHDSHNIPARRDTRAQQQGRDGGRSQTANKTRKEWSEWKHIDTEASL